jgi:nicotinate-nucleotide pyrophosphorylase
VNADKLKESIDYARELSPAITVEVSGEINLENVRATLKPALT